MKDFELLLFSTEPDFARVALAAGVGGLLIDWEYRGKATRQAGADTEINQHTVDDLRRMRAATNSLIVCRLNSYGPETAAEVETAVDAGADEMLLPMVRSVAEVEALLAQAAGRIGVGILVETPEAVALSDELARLPLSRVYVGLNDLAIARGTTNIFTAVADGTLESVRRAFPQPFGFGGLTLPEAGAPIPCRLLIAEMARLQCSFSFLRRSFYRDIHVRTLSVEVPRLLAALHQAAYRPAALVEAERQALETAISTSNHTFALSPFSLSERTQPCIA